MRYYDITNATIVSERQILKANPSTSFALPLSDAALAGLNMAKLLEDARPSYDADTQTVIEGAVEERDGSYFQTFSVIDRSAEAIQHELDGKKANVRAQRDARLAETDWAMMPDSPLIDYDKGIMASYRTALRDVPAQAGFPDNALPEGPDQQPFASWTYNSTDFIWEAPLPKPDGNAVWDEDAYQEDNTTGWITI